MPEPMKQAACTAIHGDINQYAVTWGAPNLRVAIAEKYRRWYGMEVDPDREVEKPVSVDVSQWGESLAEAASRLRIGVGDRLQRVFG